MSSIPTEFRKHLALCHNWAKLSKQQLQVVFFGHNEQLQEKEVTNKIKHLNLVRLWNLKTEFKLLLFIEFTLFVNIRFCCFLADWVME